MSITSELTLRNELPPPEVIDGSSYTKCLLLIPVKKTNKYDSIVCILSKSRQNLTVRPARYVQSVSGDVRPNFTPASTVIRSDTS